VVTPSDPKETLDRIVCRNGNCGVNDIKADPEFNNFLSQVLMNFNGLNKEPESDELRNFDRLEDPSLREYDDLGRP